MCIAGREIYIAGRETYIAGFAIQKAKRGNNICRFQLK
jgi:hypothetical protein